MLAPLGVFGTGAAWPDLIVAALMAGLGLWGGARIIGQARAGLRPGPVAARTATAP